MTPAQSGCSICHCPVHVAVQPSVSLTLACPSEHLTLLSDLSRCRWLKWAALKKSMSTRRTGPCAQTWTWTDPTLHQREASSTACSEERQVLVLRQLFEGVGAKVLPLPFLSSLSLTQTLFKHNTCEFKKKTFKPIIFSFFSFTLRWFDQGLSSPFSIISFPHLVFTFMLHFVWGVKGDTVLVHSVFVPL